jgi:hypothetical protein
MQYTHQLPHAFHVPLGWRPCTFHGPMSLHTPMGPLPHALPLHGTFLAAAMQVHVPQYTHVPVHVAPSPWIPCRAACFLPSPSLEEKSNSPPPLPLQGCLLPPSCHPCSTRRQYHAPRGQQGVGGWVGREGRGHHCPTSWAPHPLPTSFLPSFKHLLPATGSGGPHMHASKK